MVESDNTAADALLKLVGGADVVERRLRAMGFQKINVDRSEGQLLLDMAGVTNAPPPEQWTIELQRRLVAEVDRESLNMGRARYLTDERDTATPHETAQLLGRLQLGDLLAARGNGSAAEPHAANDDRDAHASRDAFHRTRSSRTRPARRPSSSTMPASSRCRRTAKSRAVSRLSVFVADGSSIAAMERSVAQMSAAAFEFFTGRTIPQRPAQRTTTAARPS